MPCPQPDDSATVSAPDASTSTICVKCRINPAISIFRDSIYCQPCALAVFYQKAKSGLEYARGAGLAKYVAAAKAGTPASSPAASTSAAAPSANGEGSKGAKQVNNGGGNAEVHVSANIAIAFSGGSSSRALLRSAVQYFRPETVVDRTVRRKKGRGEKVEATPIDASSDRKNGAGATGRFNEVGKIYVLFIDDRLEPLSPEQHVVPPTVSTNDILSNQNSNVPAMDKSSIARLTETFILNLEKGVPSTVTTIGKTGSKLVLNSPTDPTSSEVESVANSTAAFQQADENGAEAHMNGGKVDGDEEEAESKDNGQAGGYGNHRTPQPLKQSEMKTQINEFLLED
ncbi:hypothetical protein NDA16_004345 [Ustilago loliicola]|nr:hypothetical protein NDA16_004345 [Ustilago loliicola]